MKHLHHPKYLVRYKVGRRESDLASIKVWNGRDLLVLGHPARFLLQSKNDQVWIRDLSAAEGVKTKVLTSHPQISLEPIQQRAPIAWDKVANAQRIEFAAKDIADAEESFFNKQLIRIAGSAALAMLAIFLFKPSEPDLKMNEDLIPKKYAKLIMTKPKEKSVATQGGASQSQGQKKAIARVFQSASVQKSMRSILKGGISKYSIMSTGRAISSLASKVSATSGGTGLALNTKADSLMAGANTGPIQVGSGTGYGSGSGTNVHGQGNGQLEIGLNTADASVDEGLTKDEVARVIHAHLNEIRFCYESAILKDPALAGKVLVDFKINPTGIVPNAGISDSTIGGNSVGSCLIAKLKNWKFPQPRGGVYVAVSYPFIFKSLSR